MMGGAMPLRATKRGAARTRLERDCDVLICGASFAGLAVARELAGSGARVTLIDRYEIGERQTSACAAPTLWLEALGLGESIRQTFATLVIHSPQRTFRYDLPWTFSTFDYPELCALLHVQGDAEFETAKVDGITRAEGRVGGDGSAPLSGATVHAVHTDRGDVRAPLVVDALGWKRVLSTHDVVQPPHQGTTRGSGETPGRARLSRGLEVHPGGTGEDLEIWIDPLYIRAGYGWSFPAGDELRVGVGSFEPRDHVKQPTVRLADDLGLPPDGYQGNWIPHKLRPAVDDGVFFAGDSAGHCLPLTAEGIRTAFYFGLACGRELRAVAQGRMHRETALARYGAFSDEHAWSYAWLLNSQHVVGRITGRRALSGFMGAIERPRIVHWMFNHYLNIAPPSFAHGGDLRFSAPPARMAAAVA
jgi:flavin-dependent dehydrogenase